MPEFRLLPGRGLELFLSAVNLPRQRWYSTIHDKAAALFRSLVKNHPLVDGNKRLAVVAMDVFLIVNRVDFKVPHDVMVQAALTIAGAEGNFPLDVVAGWIRAGCRGRPRSLIAMLAEGWPEAREDLLREARAADVAAGKKSRIPGRRVRLSNVFWERMRPTQLPLIE